MCIHCERGEKKIAREKERKCVREVFNVQWKIAQMKLSIILTKQEEIEEKGEEEDKTSE